MTREVVQPTVATIAERFIQGDSAVAIAQEALTRIEANNQQLNAFVFVDEDTVLAQARAIDEKRACGEPVGPLAGVPIGIKDALACKDLPATACSSILVRRAADATDRTASQVAVYDATRGFRPPYDATVVARLRDAGAIIIGKCNMDEFAMGSSNENSAAGPVHNPWNLDHIPGGSSGGSAVAVASGMISASLGSDTGGSVRQPAALSGAVGLKPTYGRVSRFGLIAFASSLDQVGPMANDVRGAARIFAAIAGPDPHDATCSGHPLDPYEQACDASIRGLRIGIPSEYLGDGVDDDTRAAVDATLNRLVEAGATTVPVALPHTQYAVATYYVLATAECSSNLSRFDGVRFGYRNQAAHSLADLYRHSRSDGFGAEVKRRILLGTFVLSAGYYDAYYHRAQCVRTKIADDFRATFEHVDVIATPVAPTTAFRLGEKSNDPLAMYLADVFTLPASLAGVPAISVPCGLGKASQLPVGLQLIGPAFSEGLLFKVAATVERLVGHLGEAPHGCLGAGSHQGGAA